MTPRSRRWAYALTTTLAIGGCVDGALTTAVQVPTDDRAVLERTAGSAEILGMLKRTEALPSGLSASGVIGPKGGHLQIGRAGLQVEFAPGAVAERTHITVTAVAGDVIAYRFQPHGLVFRAPVTIRQSLRNTAAWQNPAVAAELQGSYFERLLVDRTRTWSRSDERRPARLVDSARFLEFPIEHFSGYQVSLGKAPVEVDVDVEISR